MINILKNKLEKGDYSMSTSESASASKRVFSDSSMDDYSTGSNKRTSDNR